MSNVLSNTPPRTSFIMPDCDVVLTPNWHQVFKISDDQSTLLGCSDYYNELTRLGITAPTDLVVPRGITTIKQYAFNYPLDPDDMSTFDIEYMIRSLILPEGLLKIEYMAISGLNSLESITLPSTIKEIETGGLSQNKALKEIVLPEGLEKIGGWLVQYGDSLESAYIPSTLKEISYGIFFGCTSLVKVDISNGPTIIGDRSFGNCTALTSITIPSSVTSIHADSFKNSINLMNININKPRNSITGAPWGATNATINWLG